MVFRSREEVKMSVVIMPLELNSIIKVQNEIIRQGIHEDDNNDV